MKFLVLLFVFGCATSTPVVPPTARTVYYTGTVTTSSPDGAIAFGPPVATVARREIDPGAGTIEEQVFYEGALRTTRLVRFGPQLFRVADVAGTFSGLITVDKPWNWGKWSYDISLSDESGKIGGSGQKTEAGFRTEKTFSVGGTPRARIVEVFVEVDATTFEAALSQLLN